MNIYKILDISKWVISGLNLSLQSVLVSPNDKENYDIGIDHNNYIVIRKREKVVNTNEYETLYNNEYWKTIIIISLRDNEFNIIKVIESLPYPFWERDVLSKLNHYLKHVKIYFNNPSSIL